MSLINKMLQDLDARGATAGQALPDNVHPVPQRERHFPLRVAWSGAALIVAVILALSGWRYMHAPVAALLQAPLVAKAPLQAPLVARAPLPPAAAVPALLPPAVSRVVVPLLPAQLLSAPLLPAPAAVDETAPAPGKRKRLPAMLAPQPPRPAVAAAIDARALAPGPVPAPGLSSRQTAENDYRRALAALQEGRTGEAVTGLEQALAADPRHDAARQTLIGLLLEGGRADDAIYQLRLGLALDARQVALAMVLARLQVERGGPALDTLMRTLPFAGGNGPYQAFLAALLERGGRHVEAAEHYRLALQTAPQNGLWWMGLGLALQADKQAAQARDAFAHARAASGLTPELQAFVEHQLLLLNP